MNDLDAIIEEIAHYLEWAMAQPFGAPTHTDAYREHLIVRAMLEGYKSAERD